MMEYQESRDSLGSSDPEAARLVALLAREGVDDLAKLRIAQFLWRAPNVVGDAAFFARVLGFHSPSSTQYLLDELVGHGLLLCWQSRGATVRYGLPRDDQGRSGLGWLRMQVEASTALPNVVRLLAQRSLARARRAAAAERRRGHRRSVTLGPVH